MASCATSKLKGLKNLNLVGTLILVKICNCCMIIIPTYF